MDGRSVVFGKNSDREPNEAQQIVSVGRKIRNRKTVKATFIEVEHPAETFEVILSKPFQMFGAEMGCNEYGVVIGNEAVFTNVPFDKKRVGLTGMDMVRLSLEVSKTAKEALEYIICLLEKYGQDACGGYTNKKFYYHNSFLIGDRTQGFQLETAGRHWVYKKIKGFAAISNGLSITSDYDAISQGIPESVYKNRGNKEFSFKDTFSQFLLPKIAAYEHRADVSKACRLIRPDFGVKDAFTVLRQHHTPFQINTSGNKSICMHATGLLCPNATVGSMVVELPKEAAPVVWLTGTSTPCLSYFKPFYFGSEILREENFLKPWAISDESYWWRWEKLFRNAIFDYEEIKEKAESFQNSLEDEWFRKASLYSESTSIDAMLKTEEVLKELSSAVLSKKRLGFFYNRYRNKLNQKTGIA